MMRLGLIGGTAMTSLAADVIEITRLDQIVAQTSYGEVPLTCVQSGNSELIFLERHHGEGTTPPHNINHRANLEAMAGAGVDAILAVCSVGTIPGDFPPGSVGYATQYLDFTGVTVSFYDDDAKFTSMTKPFDLQMNETLESVLSSSQPGLSLKRTYWLAQGPQFETAAEIDAIEKLGGEVVGMTMPRECKLAAEIGIPYAAILVASNWAAGREPGNSGKDLDHQEVSSTAESRLGPVVECIKAFTQ
jgi:purine nucleoside phosphorylase